MTARRREAARVEQLMTKEVRTCTPVQTLNDAARAMWEGDCGCIPVLAEEGRDRVVGVLTDRDICMAAYTQGRTLREVRIGDVMTRAVLSCGPGDTLDEAEATMRAGRVRRLPVVDDAGKLLGILSLADIARDAEQRGARAGGPRAADVGRTLAEITRRLSIEVGSSELV